MYSKENISIHNLKSHRNSLKSLFNDKQIDQETINILSNKGYISVKRIKKLTNKTLIDLGIIDKYQRLLLLNLIDDYLKQNPSSTTSLKNIDKWTENSIKSTSKVILCKLYVR